MLLATQQPRRMQLHNIWITTAMSTLWVSCRASWPISLTTSGLVGFGRPVHWHPLSQGFCWTHSICSLPFSPYDFMDWMELGSVHSPLPHTAPMLYWFHKALEERKREEEGGDPSYSHPSIHRTRYGAGNEFSGVVWGDPSQSATDPGARIYLLSLFWSLGKMSEFSSMARVVAQIRLLIVMHGVTIPYQPSKERHQGHKWTSTKHSRNLSRFSPGLAQWPLISLGMKSDLPGDDSKGTEEADMVRPTT